MFTRATSTFIDIYKIRSNERQKSVQQKEQKQTNNAIFVKQKKNKYVICCERTGQQTVSPSALTFDFSRVTLSFGLLAWFFQLCFLCMLLKCLIYLFISLELFGFCSAAAYFSTISTMRCFKMTWLMCFIWVWTFLSLNLKSNVCIPCFFFFLAPFGSLTYLLKILFSFSCSYLLRV